MLPSPADTAHGLAGRIVAAGPDARAALATLLGLGEGDGGFGVVAAAWLDHALEVAVAVGESTPAVLRIERRNPESQGLVVTPHLVLYTWGAQLPQALMDRLRRTAGRRLERVTLDHLAALVERDSQSGKPGLPMPPVHDEQHRPRSMLDTWGADDSWADFFAGGELARSQLDSIDPARLFRFAQHCDSECHFVNPHSVAGLSFLVSYPWDNRVREPWRPFEQGMANLTDPEFIEEGLVTTDLDEDDVIRGNPAKLEGLIDYATSRPNPDGKVLFLSNTCVPTVTGEDVESAVRRARDRTGKPILYLTVTPRSMTNVFQDLLVDRRKAAEQAVGTPTPETVNLIGFADSEASSELHALLRAGGVAVNAQLIPSMSMDRIDALAHGACNVFCPNRLWQHLYDELLTGARSPHVMPQAPYGMRATRQWFEAVVRAARPTAALDLDAAWRSSLGGVLAEWETLTSEASRYRLGFVVRDAEAYYLTSPDATWGVPLLATVEDMGFGVDVLVHVSEPELAKRTARAIRQQFRDASRHSIRAFDSFAFLRQRLRESESSAFLSYHTYDWRLSEAGKGRFSIQHFEMGPQGALRTLERLLQVCRGGFYSRYRKYLQRSRLGLRDAKPSAAPREGGHG